MSKLKQLAVLYANEDKSIPVEYYSHTGTLLRGSIQRLDDDVAIVVTRDASAPIRVKINVTGMAGVANPQEWCLTREGRDRYCTIDTNGGDELRQQRLVMITNAFEKIKRHADDVHYHYVDQWTGLFASDIAGFVSFNLNTPDVPITGFLVFLDGRIRFVHAVPVDVKLRPM
jgi:hypothetical protein